jgi:hypothetical protein
MENVEEANVELRPGRLHGPVSNSTFFNSTFDIQHLGSEVLTQRPLDCA